MYVEGCGRARRGLDRCLALAGLEGRELVAERRCRAAQASSTTPCLITPRGRPASGGERRTGFADPSLELSDEPHRPRSGSRVRRSQSELGEESRSGHRARLGHAHALELTLVAAKVGDEHDGHDEGHGQHCEEESDRGVDVRLAWTASGRPEDRAIGLPGPAIHKSARWFSTSSNVAEAAGCTRFRAARALAQRAGTGRRERPRGRQIRRTRPDSRGCDCPRPSASGAFPELLRALINASW